MDALTPAAAAAEAMRAARSVFGGWGHQRSAAQHASLTVHRNLADFLDLVLNCMQYCGVCFFVPPSAEAQSH